MKAVNAKVSSGRFLSRTNVFLLTPKIIRANIRLL